MSVTVLSSVMAQSPLTISPERDSAVVKAGIGRAKTIAGSEWAEAVHLWCEAPPENRTVMAARMTAAPEITPTKIFDNLYVMGRTSTIILAITTSDGIVLFDSGFPDQVESVLVSQMKTLGLDPAAVKHIFITHGHYDHFGGAPYFQQRYGTRVYLAAADWDLIQNDPTSQKRDQVIVDGVPIVIGGISIIPVSTPGHTPGSTSLLFPVTDQGRTHMAGLFGGALMGETFYYSDNGTPQFQNSAEGMQQYLHSVERMRAEGRKHRVDVEFINHPVMDGFNDRLSRIRQQKSGAPNPFIIGETSYQKLLDVMSTCAQTTIYRREQ